MNRLIKADLYRHGGRSGIKGFFGAWFISGFRYTFLFRKVQQHKKYSIPGIFYRLLLRRYSFKYGFQINPRAQIGEGFFLSEHQGPIIIGAPVKIGKNCNVAHTVTLGQTLRGPTKGHPTIDDNVWIGTGAVITGKIKIGKNVLIAPNSFVSFNVPDNSIVVGNPARIFKNDNATLGYINNILEEK